ncbi:hypothetical protein B0H13DRAFT_1860255 [Mycena leptocephala]|nr:hypothetical protein B0H13DRAFT_1860255 [Mycena leptocephala]
MSSSPPPTVSLTPHQLRYRLRLKSAPAEEQEAATQRAREARARYRDKNREHLKDLARCQRIVDFGKKHGMLVYEQKLQQRLARRRLRSERPRRRSTAKAKKMREPTSMSTNAETIEQTWAFAQQYIQSRGMLAGERGVDVNFRLPDVTRPAPSPDAASIRAALNEGHRYAAYFKEHKPQSDEAARILINYYRQHLILTKLLDLLREIEECGVGCVELSTSGEFESLYIHARSNQLNSDGGSGNIQSRLSTAGAGLTSEYPTIDAIHVKDIELSVAWQRKDMAGQKIWSPLAPMASPSRYSNPKLKFIIMRTSDALGKHHNQYQGRIANAADHAERIRLTACVSLFRSHHSHEYAVRNPLGVGAHIAPSFNVYTAAWRDAPEATGTPFPDKRRLIFQGPPSTTRRGPTVGAASSVRNPKREKDQETILRLARNAAALRVRLRQAEKVAREAALQSPARTRIRYPNGRRQQRAKPLTEEDLYLNAERPPPLDMPNLHQTCNLWLSLKSHPVS